MDEKKKKVILGSIAGVILVVAAVLIIRGMGGNTPPPLPKEEAEMVDSVVKELEVAPDPNPEPFDPNANPKQAKE